MTVRTRHPKTGCLGLTLLLALGACNAGTDDDSETTGSAGQADAGETAGSAGDQGAAGSKADAGAPDAASDGPSFSADIHPLLVASCNGCHADMVVSGPPRPGMPGGPVEGGGNAPGKFAVDDASAAYTAVMPYVHAGDPEASTLYIKISQDSPSTGGQRMPPALRQWDDAAIAAVREWIAAGAKDN